MEEIKLSGNNRLPKYWVVQCPEKSNSEELDRFRNTVIRYMEEVIGERWRGDAYLSYYGYDGNSSFRGTNYNCSLKDFVNSPTLLTIDEFIELSKPIEVSKLPEKWRVFVKKYEDIEEYLIEKYEKVDEWITATEEEFWLYSDSNTMWASPKYVSIASDIEYTEIDWNTFQENVLNKVNKSNEIKKPSTMNEFEFSVEGSESLKKAFAEEVGVKFYTPESIDYNYIGYQEERTLQGWSGKSRNKHFSLPEDWNDAISFAKKAYGIKKEIYFGDLKLTITQGNDYADTEYGKIYKADIEKVVTMFDKKIRILGYYLKVNDIDNIKVSFGCKTDTIGKAREILEMFNS